jgi:chitodextrinase
MQRRQNRALLFAAVAGLLLALGTAALPAAGAPGRALSSTAAAFAPVADAYVSSMKPGANYGQATRLKAEQSPVLRTYLRFNPSDVTGTVTRATLRLYVTAKSTVGYDVRGVADTTWGESKVTYSNAPPASATVATSGGYASGTWTSVDVTPLVAGNGPVSFAVTTPSTTALSIASRESGSTSPALVIETSALADTTPPSAPAGLTVTGASGSSISMSWAASSDDAGVAGYDLFVDGVHVGGTATTSYTFGGLSCGTSYTLGVEAHDASGNHSLRTQLYATTSACADTVAPTTPTNLTVTAATGSSVSLSWGASFDNVGVVGYDVYKNGNNVGPSATTTYTVTGLSCGTTTTFAVAADDAAGNRSPQAAITASTAACSDVVAPTPPGGVTVSAATATSVSLSWQPSSDNVAVTGYSLYLNGTAVGSTASTSYAFSGLTCGTSYALAVDAYDAAGNHSTKASTSVSTSACATGSTPQIKYRFAYSNRLDQGLMPGYGYNLIDVATKSEADATPAGTLGQVWLYDYDNTTCTWEKDDAYIRNMVSSMADDPKVAGFYFSNEPDPFACPNAPQQHRDRSALIKSLAPNKYTLIGIDANWRDHFDRYGSIWVGTADYVNYNPYICYERDTSSCDFAWLDHVLQTAQSLPQPYFIALQAFREAGEWRWPTAAEETQMLNRLKDPSLTGLRGYLTFSWNWQNDSLLNHRDVLQAIKDFNLGTSSAPADTSAPTPPSELSVTSATQTSLSLSWKGSTDNVGVAGYGAYRNGTFLASTAATSYTVGGLSCGTSYTIGVDAYDAAGNRSTRSTATASTAACAPAGGDPVIAAAGDICSSPSDCAPTATLLDSLAPTRVLTLGDNAYPDGTSSDYASYYDPNWGRFKAKTSPAPGNHDYHTSGGSGYFAYFGSQAPAAYYSFDIGSWHLISLNGEIGVSAGSAQETWLKNDLAAHPSKCTLAYWHEPRFSSGAEHGNNSSFDPFWRDLYAAGVDVVLNGHDHEYERFAPQNPSGAADANGIREFVVGTGGASHYTFATPVANSEVRDNTSFGVLKLTLHSASYDWQFVPVAGASFTDSGTTSCH